MLVFLCSHRWCASKCREFYSYMSLISFMPMESPSTLITTEKYLNVLTRGNGISVHSAFPFQSRPQCFGHLLYSRVLLTCLLTWIFVPLFVNKHASNNNKNLPSWQRAKVTDPWIEPCRQRKDSSKINPDLTMTI